MPEEETHATAAPPQDLTFKPKTACKPNTVQCTSDASVDDEHRLNLPRPLGSTAPLVQ